MSIKWNFPSNYGGRDNGLNDPGVETFKGNFDRYLARELGQNSLDARRDARKPVLLKFEFLEMDRDSIPHIDFLQDVFVRSAKFWAHAKKAKDFFNNAEKLARAEKIDVLKVGDYNTTGVLGSDTDKKKNWYNLIRCAGASSKDAGEGGSYGIGKKAPFAASHMRTVLYSTYNTDGNHAFVGVCDGATFDFPGRSGKAQGIGFLGGAKGTSIRKKSQIPIEFRRKEYGADLYIMGFPRSLNWEEDLVYSVLDNFWPAIHLGDLEVHVGEIKITKKTLPKLMDQFSSEMKRFTAHLYYKAFTSQTHFFEGTLPILGKVECYFSTGDPELPKNVVMVRKTGMVIWNRAFRSPVAYCGVFVCRSVKGNALLREMEPPKHDTWDADHPEKGANKAAEAEYFGFIRECVGKLAPEDDSTIINIPGLSRFLPDDEDTPEEEFESGSGEPVEEAKSEGATPNILPTKILPSKIESRKRSMQPDGQKPDEGEDETETKGSDGSGPEPGKEGKTETEGGKDGGSGGNAEGNMTPAIGGKGGVSSKPAIPIRYRAYCQDSTAGVYVLSVTAEKATDTDANLIVWTVGDDQKMPADIKSAKLTGGNEVGLAKNGILGPIKLPECTPLKIEVTLRHAARVAMEVSAHEA
jgi:hypothetical protein